MTTTLAGLIDTLRAAYSDAVLPPLLEDPVELLLWEAVAYLVDDERRATAFAALKRSVGTEPEQILAAPPGAIEAVVKGMRPADRAERVRQIAELAIELFGADPKATLAGLDTKKAISLLRKFPGTGKPGAEKVLLFSGIAPILALESNGLRVLLRVGYGAPQDSYDKAYADVRRALERDRGRETGATRHRPPGAAGPRAVHLPPDRAGMCHVRHCVRMCGRQGRARAAIRLVAGVHRAAATTRQGQEQTPSLDIATFPMIDGKASRERRPRLHTPQPPEDA